MTESIIIEGRWIINKTGRDYSEDEFSGMLIIRPGNPAVLIPDKNIKENCLKYSGCDTALLKYKISGDKSDNLSNICSTLKKYSPHNISKSKGISCLPRITGRGISGSEITLTGNKFITGIIPEIFSDGYKSESGGYIVSETVIEGHRFTNNDEITFCTLLLFPEEFMNWTGCDIFREVIESDYSEIVISSSENFVISIAAHNFPGQRKIKESSLNPALVIRYPYEKNYDDIKNDLKAVQEFLSFLMNKPSFFLYIQGYHERNPNLSDYAGKKIMDLCNIYSGRSRFNDRKFQNYSGYGNFLVGFNEIKDDFDRYFAGWQKFSEIYGSFSALYFSTVFNPEMYKENRFLAYAECLEIYHRKNEIFRDFLVDPKEYEERISTVKKLMGENKVFTKKIRESIVNTLKFGNKPNLENRMNDLCYFFRDYLSAYIDDYEKFSSDVSVNRNFIVHREAKEGLIYADNYELEKIIIMLELMIYLIFHYESGFDAELIKDIAERFVRKKLENINQY